MNEFVRGAGRDIAVGIDLGGTNLRASLFEGLARAARGGESEAPKAVMEVREAVGDARDPDAISDRLADVVREMCVAASLPVAQVPVGIGFAGMLRGDAGHVVNSPHFGWHDVGFGAALRRKLDHSRRVHVYNDVNAIAYAEFGIGAARGATDMLAVFVGTGIGGAVISNGALVTGATGCAGEIGHTKVVFDDRAAPCKCGLRGCVEAYLGGRALQRRVRAELRGGARSAATKLAGDPDNVHPSHLDAAAAAGDRYALDLYAELAPLLGAVLANAITLLNPSHLVLGGGMMSRTPVLRDHVVAALEVAANPPALHHLTICDGALGDDAGVVGSALLALSGS